MTKIDPELLTRGVDKIIEKEHLEKVLTSGKKLRVKFGVDPTSSQLHLGHAVSLFKLKAFQELGHTIIFLIGDFTARIGDPSGRTSGRRKLTKKEVDKNLTDYLKTAGKIVDVDKAELRNNSEWYDKMSGAELVELASKVSIQQLLHREEFQKRQERGKDISLQETMYPLLQGYDSVMLESDLEVGGTDQTFNMLMGRTMQRKFGQDPQDVLVLSLLVGLDGSKKMGKTDNNYIAINDSSEEKFGKIMSIPDTLIEQYFALATKIPLEEIRKIMDESSPRDAKARLALEVAALYHGKDEAKMAEQEFDKVFRDKGIPSTIPELKVGDRDTILVVDALVEAGLVSSKSEARRKISESGVKLSGRLVVDSGVKITIRDIPTEGEILQIGKRKFVRISR